MSAIRKPDDVLRTYLSLAGLGMIVVGWIVGVILKYQLPQQYFFQGLFYAAKATPFTPVLWIGPFLGLILAMPMYAIGFKRWQTGFQGADFISRIGGAKMISPWMLSSMTKTGKAQLRIADIPIPEKVESTHFAITGSTGTGKSNAINGYIDSVKERKERMICVDPDGGFMQYHYKPGDVILNPFDARTSGWSIFNEIRNDFDCDQYAIAIIPRSPSTDQEQWNSMARTIVTETLAALLRSGQATTERLVYWLTQAPNDDLKALLLNTPAAGCFHGAEETMGSIRTVLTRYITPHKYLPAGNFSFREWVEKSDAEKGNVWVTWREDMIQSLKPLISCWVDVSCAAVLSIPEKDAKPIHGIYDELDSLEKLHYLEQAGTKGRKHGFRLVAGFQSLSQLNQTYGRDGAMTLRSVLRTILALGVGEMDSLTAEEMSKAFGEHEVVRRRISHSGGKRNSATVKEKEPLVRPTELHLLPNLTGYLKIAGNYPVARITMKYKPRVKVTEPIMLSDVFKESIKVQDRLFSLRG